MADSMEHGNAAVVIDMAEHPQLTAVQGRHEALPMAGRSAVPFFTPGVIVLSILAVAGLAVLMVRLIWGLEAVTNLNDQYPWGIWIGIDVASGVPDDNNISTRCCTAKPSSSISPMVEPKAFDKWVPEARISNSSTGSSSMHFNTGLRMP